MQTSANTASMVATGQEQRDLSYHGRDRPRVPITTTDKLKRSCRGHNAPGLGQIEKRISKSVERAQQRRRRFPQRAGRIQTAMRAGLRLREPPPFRKALSQIAGIYFHRFTDVNEGKRPVPIVLKDPFFGVLEQTARVRPGQDGIFLKTFDGIQEDGEHQFLFGLEAARSLPLVAVLLGGEHIKICGPMKRIEGDRKSTRL